MKTTLRFDIGEGLRFLWNQKILRTLAVMTGVFNFASNAAFAVLVLFAVGPASEMKLSEVGFGLLLTTSALGAFVGSFIAERVEARLGRSKSLALTIFGGALFVGAPALTDNPYILGPLFFVGGMLIVLWNVITVSLRQRIAPNRLLGRVNSAYRLLAWGTMPLGAAAGGLLAQWLGLQAMFGIMGAADPRAARDDAHPHGQGNCRGRRRILRCAGPFPVGARCNSGHIRDARIGRVGGQAGPFVDLEGESARGGLAADEAQSRGRAAVGEEAAAEADDDGSDHEPELIDQLRGQH